jgi:hypothetical protein
MPEVATGLCHLSLSAGDSKKIVPAIPLHDFVEHLGHSKMRMPDMETEKTPEEASLSEVPDRLPFPPVTYSHILHCSYHEWHPRYAFASYLRHFCEQI